MGNIFKRIFKEAQVETVTPVYNLIDYRSNDLLKYEIFTKEKYMEYSLNRLDGIEIKKSIKGIEERWNKIRKGYNFIIGVGKKPDLMFYSVEYFDKHILGRINE